MKKIHIIFIVLFLPFCGSGQQLHQIPHLPSTEVYDMLIDKKGFIWIAHNLGVSRHDGISFTNFNNPEQSSLSATDLIEDNYGRIWFHNFNGQIFYIQNDKMFYLKEYDFKKEPLFPRMVLYGNDILVSSTDRGLFICNTATLKSDYIKIRADFAHKFEGISSICVIKNKVLAYGANKWYYYTKKEGLSVIKNPALLFKREISHRMALQPEAHGDTAFMINNSENILYGVTLKDSILQTVFKKHISANMNTVSLMDGKTWINTKGGSFTLNGKDSIKGYNITRILKDSQGNKWFSSLSDGLLVEYKTLKWHPLKLTGFDITEHISFIQKTGTLFAIANQAGKILITTHPLKNENGKFYYTPSQDGSLENIQAADSNSFFIKTSPNSYILNILRSGLKSLDFTGNIKDIAINNKIAFLGLSSSVQIEDITSWKLNMPVTNRSFSINDTILYKNLGKRYLNKRLRCRALLFDTSTNSLLISYSDGLQRLSDNKFSFITYHGQPLYVSSMVRFLNKIYAATYNNGLFIIDRYNVKKANNDASSYPGIVKLKLCNKHLWIFKPHDVEVLNVETNEFVNTIYPFPVDASDINDVEEDSSSIYLATHHGLFTMPLATGIDVAKADPSLLYVLVNNTDTVYTNSISLAFNKNNLLFRLAIPVYKNAEQVHFKYRLLNGDTGTLSQEDSDWYYTQDAQRDIQFNALKPGSYVLQLIAVKDNEVISNSPLVYHFSIQQPWYGTWWFYTTVVLFIVAVSIGVQQYRLKQLLKIDRIRRKISNDLHDDIGSTLSSINIYSQLAKTEKDYKEYVDTIQDNTVSIINSLDDLVWNINPKNDVLEHLLTRMRLFSEPLLMEKNIRVFFKAKTSNPDTLIPPNLRANIYLLFKEIVNNILKHANSTMCSIYIIQKGHTFRLIVTDNGKGFDTKTTNRHRNGLYNMQARVKDIKGSIAIKSSPGNGTQIKITCPV